MPESRTEFFALYDYGQGGAWVIISAESAQQIRAKYPMLKVFDGEPPMLDSAGIAAIRRAGIQDIEASPTGWLAAMASK